MRKIFLAVIVSLLCIGFQSALVFSAALHDGQVRKIGPHNVELVANDGDITLYFTDDNNNKISTAHGRATATIRYPDERQTISVDLKTSKGNSLQGSGEFEIKPDTTIVIFTKLNGEDAHGGKFVLNRSKEPEEHGHHHGDHDHDHDHDHSHNDNHDDHGSSHDH